MKPFKADIYDYQDIAFVKRISIGSVDPQSPASEEQMEEQIALLNKCLSNYPRGRIIGKEISTGLFQMGEHQVSLQNITYHVGFTRKPHWFE